MVFLDPAAFELKRSIRAALRTVFLWRVLPGIGESKRVSAKPATAIGLFNQIQPLTRRFTCIYLQVVPDIQNMRAACRRLPPGFVNCSTVPKPREFERNLARRCWMWNLNGESDEEVFPDSLSFLRNVVLRTERGPAACAMETPLHSYRRAPDSQPRNRTDLSDCCGFWARRASRLHRHRAHRCGFGNSLSPDRRRLEAFCHRAGTVAH